MNKSARKVLLSVFWNFLEQDKSGTEESYCSLLTTLREKNKKEERGKLSTGAVVFLYINR